MRLWTESSTGQRLSLSAGEIGDVTMYLNLAYLQDQGGDSV